MSCRGCLCRANELAEVQLPNAVALVSLVKRKKMHVELVQGFLLMELVARARRELQSENTNTMHWFCMVFFLDCLPQYWYFAVEDIS